MKSYREQFESIYEIPDGIWWTDCGYFAPREPLASEALILTDMLHVFDGCSSTTALFAGLVDEMVREFSSDKPTGLDIDEWVSRANQSLGR